MAKFDPIAEGATPVQKAFDPIAEGATAVSESLPTTSPQPVIDNAKDVYSISQQTGIPTEIVEPNMQVLTEEKTRLDSSETEVKKEGKVGSFGQLEQWNPSIWERIRLYFYKPRPLTRQEKPLRTLAKLGAVGAASAASGVLLNFPDIAAAKITGEPTLGGAVAKALGIELKPKEVSEANLIKNITSLMTAGALTRPVVAKLPARAAYRYLLGGGSQFATKELAAQTVERITIDDPIEFQEINREFLIGTLFGAGEAVVAKASRYLRFKDFIKARPEFQDADKFPPKLIKKMFEAGDAVQGGMKQAAVEKVYGRDIDDFLGRLNTHFGRGTTGAPLATTGAGPETQVQRNMIRRYDQGIAEAQARGDTEAAEAMALMRTLEFQKIKTEIAAKKTEKPIQAIAKADAAAAGKEAVTFPSESLPAEVTPESIQQPSEFEDLSGNAIPLNADGTITVFHRTDASQEDIASKGFKSLENTNEVFVSTKKDGQAEGFGENVVEMHVPADQLRMDDAFDDEVHFAVDVVAADKAMQAQGPPPTEPPAPATEEPPAPETTEQLISQALKEARRVRPLTEAEQSRARKQRVAAAASVMERNIAKGVDPAEVAVFRSTGLLKGELANYNQVFEPIRDKLNAVDPELIDNTFRGIAKSDMQYFSKLDTASAFRKLIDGQSLTFREADLLDAQFGSEIGADAKERIAIAPLGDRINTIWRAGLLTGIKTSGLNTFSNFTHGLTETGKDVPAVAVDTVISLFTGERTIGLTVRGVPSGMVEGAQKGWAYLKTGKDERNIGEKFDYKRINFGTGPVARGLQAYEETIFHLMGAEDQPFYYGAKARSLFSQAIAQAKNQKLKGTARKDYINNAVANPTDEMLIYATHDAEVAVFQNKTKIGDLAHAFQQGPGGKWIVPFSRTPGSVATQIVNYTPVGPIGEVVNQASKGEFDQRLFSQAAGRGIFGVGVLAAGAALFKAGLITLDRPKSKKEQALWESEGRKANSILINGKWMGLNTLGPAGSVLGIGGHFQNNFDETGSPSQAFIAAVSGGAKSFSEQTFVTGANRAMQAISDPERGFETYFASMAGSFVPTLVADIARATDTTERRSKGAVERIKSRIPGLRETLEPRIGAYGQDLPRYGGNTIEIMIDPTRPSVVRRDVVVDEVRRLWDEGIKVAPSKLGDRDGYDILTPQENTTLWRRAGDLIHTSMYSVITSEKGEKIEGVEVETAYKDIKGVFQDGVLVLSADQIKGKIIDKLVSAAQNTARAEAAQHKLSQGVPMEDLRESGLVTNEVLKTMIQIGALE